jgi:hypothetical protein
MSSYDSYGEDIAGQAYSSYADTPGDAGGNDNFVIPTTITTINPTDREDIAPPPSQRLNLIDRLGGGIQGIKDYFGDPDNRSGILSGLIGTALFGPFGGIVAGSAGKRFSARNNNLLTGMNTIDYDDPIINNETIGMDLRDRDLSTIYSGGGGIKDYLINKSGLQRHFDENEKLRAAANKGLISNELYNRMGGFNFKQNLPYLGDVGTFVGSTGYNLIQSIKDGQPIIDGIGDVARNYMGSAVGLTKEEKNIYDKILNKS